MIPIVKKEADKAAVMESISQLESAARAAGIRVKVGLLLHLYFCCFVCVFVCARVRAWKRVCINVRVCDYVHICGSAYLCFGVQMLVSAL